jgi:hypothetical protein
MLQARINLFDEVPRPGNLLDSGAQTEFLLMLQALPQMKNRFEVETKCHNFRWAEPAVE